MAGNEGAVSGIEKCPLSPTKEGPVLNLMNKRLRALKKKYIKILQIEESKLQGKAINKEQEEVLKTKIAVAALIDEYEKLRQPLQAAVKEELVEREKQLMAATLLGVDGGEGEISIGEEKETELIQLSQQKAIDEVRKESETQDSAVCSSDTVILDNVEVNRGVPELEHGHRASSGLVSSSLIDESISDLLTFLYFAQLFDVRSHGEASSSVLWTKAHERSSCLSYDCVTEDETSPLLETDLDDLAYFGSLLTSRPLNATLSHRDALHHCIEHAKLWMKNCEALVNEDLGVTYSRLRERLNRILSSEYFTMVPELQTVTQQAAVAVVSGTSQYASDLLVQKGGDALVSEDNSVSFASQEQRTPYQTGEQHSPSPLPLSTSSDVQSGTSTSDIATKDKLQVDACSSPDENNQAVQNGVQEEHTVVKAMDTSAQDFSQGQDRQQQQVLHVSNVSVGPRGQQGPKGGGRGNYYGSGGGSGGRGRGYANGGGARSGSGRGGYGNGWSGQYYDQGGYYFRGYNGRRSGRSSRGGNSAYNGYINGQNIRGATKIPS